jgi:succinate dehydrogenase/fumarate reductase flavoprotein subunit
MLGAGVRVLVVGAGIAGLAAAVPQAAALKSLDQVMRARQASTEVMEQSQGRLRATLDLGTGKTVHGAWQTIALPRQ